MDINLKYRLIEKIIQTEDEAILDQVKAILGEETPEQWEALPEEVKNSILESEKQIKEGKLREHQEVMNDIKKRFLK